VGKVLLASLDPTDLRWAPASHAEWTRLVREGAAALSTRPGYRTPA
jgi:hypothetical protein